MSNLNLVFTKNVVFEVTTHDFGNSLGLAASVGEGENLLRFGVGAIVSPYITPPIYGPEEKVYVTASGTLQAGDTLRTDELRGSDDDDEYSRVRLEYDEGSIFYVAPGKLIEPGEVGPPRPKAELVIEMLKVLMGRMRAVYLAGKLLEEGVQEGTVESVRLRGPDGQLRSLLEHFGLLD